MITDVPGLRVGHWTDTVARTGCTVILLPPGTTASAEVRGGAPASRELAALEVGRLVETVHAVVLTGGSAFGLAVADGVMAWCEERGIGFDTGFGVVPIVPALGIFDLANGDSTVRPGATEGQSACDAATDGPIQLGSVGAGTGALTGKWRGASNVRPGGLVSSTLRLGSLVVSSLVVVNAFGDVVDPDVNASSAAVDWLSSSSELSEASPAMANTTIGLVATNAQLDRVGCLMLAQGAHDGLARSIVPPHTRLDGDAFIAVATGALSLAEAGADLGRHVDIDQIRLLAMTATETAIRSLNSS